MQWQQQQMTSICNGTDVDVYADAAIVGEVVRWEYRNVSTGNAWTAINSTSGLMTYSALNVTETTDYRVVVMSGPCAEGCIR